MKPLQAIQIGQETPPFQTMLDIVKQSFKLIAPFWPLKNLIAVNPLQGLEDLPIEEALKAGAVYFEQSNLPKPMEAVNRETIKWLQVYFDEGQATIAMPFRQQGLYAAWRRLARYDVSLHQHSKQKREWLRALPDLPQKALAECLLRLGIPKEDYGIFLSLLLTTLPGWASYIKYRTEWPGLEEIHPHPVTQTDYLALRLIITCAMWPKAKGLIDWYKQAQKNVELKLNPLLQIQDLESNYQVPLLKGLATQSIAPAYTPAAQFVFCIDVRSEPFRKVLETTGDYQTFGFAGFFGIPAEITDTVTGESYSSCPVLISPQHKVKESPCSHKESEYNRIGYRRLVIFKQLYQSLKYTFTTPFALVEGLGLGSSLWMGLRCLAPGLASRLKTAVMQTIRKPVHVAPSLDSITLAEQCAYAEGALSMMGLTHHFAPIIVLCGHGSTTQNNAFATALDCGACGGRHGASNARILATILNRSEVREQLAKNGIPIPDNTYFIAAEHNTTTDAVTLYTQRASKDIQQLKQDLEKTRSIVSSLRLVQMKQSVPVNKAASYTMLRSQDWAQVRPEWGLAGNSAFIIAPRDLTSSLNLEGRCFLHSYDYSLDPEGRFLTTILTAPMVVAQWINTQYLFSTLDNVAYGSGSKLTQNITGKMGIMQGNASDLMTGLPLQSVYSADTQPYHVPQRLMTVVYAQRKMLHAIISAQPILQKLFGNGWVQLACIEPDKHTIYLLNRDFTWQNVH